MRWRLPERSCPGLLLPVLGVGPGADYGTGPSEERVIVGAGGGAVFGGGKGDLVKNSRGVLMARLKDGAVVEKKRIRIHIHSGPL